MSRKSNPSGRASEKFGGVDADEPQPLYEQVKRVLLDEIRTGGATPRPLGSDNELMLRFGVSRMTIRTAVDELVRQGLVRRIQGKGTFVLAPAAVEVRLDGLERFLQEWHEPHLHTDARILAFDRIAAAPDLARRLRVVAGSEVLHVRRLREADEGPVVLDDRYVAGWCMRGVTRAEAAKQSLFVSIERHSGVKTDIVEQTVIAALPEKNEATLLRIGPLQPVLKRLVLFTTEAGKPTLCGQSIYRGDRVQFHLRAARGD
jgi:GntR family transcriptional regulator